MELKGKTALITGATGKIGRALTIALAREGANCVCHFHRQKEAAADLVRQAEKLGCRGMAVGADFLDQSQVRRMFSQAQVLGPIDLLIHTAGLFAGTPMDQPENPLDRELIEVNLTAPLLLTRLFVRSLKDRSGPNPVAKIVYFADAGAVRPWKKYSFYCAAKAGLAAAAQSLAKELAPAVTVNVLAPGVVQGSLRDSDQEQRQLERIPAGRFVSMDEIVQAVLFILRTDSLTGQILTLDGGSVL